MSKVSFERDLLSNWLQEGIEKGIAKGMQLQKAKDMEMKIKEEKITLAKNKPLDEIIEFTGLTKEEIEKLN
ncbi:MAG: transposase [Rickettsia endosymbiont of Eriopis connexa]|nr:transposase [Rickettsia endosymbiont of Eriopis connexa]